MGKAKAKMAGRIKAGRLPKRVGGVKLPRRLRKRGGKLLALAASPAGQELIAGALTLMAAALKTQARRRRATGDGSATGSAAPAETAAPAAPRPPRAANAPDPHEIGVELGRMAEAAFSGLFGKRG